MIEVIKCEAELRRITRLCHFTPSRNLIHILTGEMGILATKKLQENERSAFTQTDLERLDRHEGFQAMFADAVSGAYGKTRDRLSHHLACCPTDDQAEVLIPDEIGVADILAISVPTETQAKNEVARLRIMDIKENRYKFVIAPEIFNKSISNLIRSGKRPKETPWIPRNEA